MNFLTSTFFRRLTLVLLPFTAIVVWFYSELIVSSMVSAENRTVQEYLRSEYSLFERRFAETGSEQLPSTDSLSAWWDDDANLPESFADYEPGIHMIDGETHLLVGEPGGAGRKAYLALTEPEFGTQKMIQAEMESTIYLAAGVVFVSGALLAIVVARLMSRPIQALADDVKAGQVPGKQLKGHNRNDEIGVLSRALENLINRMESALIREQAVTRYASHDMRTPVSVIRVALSVLNLPECSEEKRERNLKRIDEACADIENRIEVHLCLARESAELPAEDCDVRAMVADELAKHRHTIDAKNLLVSIEGTDDSVCTARPMLRIVLSNLIQNAVSYSARSIRVSVESDGFTITNACEADDRQIDEEGLGLEIVQRVCNRMRWAFSTGTRGDEFEARVVFNARPEEER